MRLSSLTKFLALVLIAASPQILSAQNVVVTPGNLQGWNPYDMRNGGTAGGNTEQPRSGDGSLNLDVNASPDKAGWSITFGATSMQSFFAPGWEGGFDWYRSSTSLAADHFTPVFSFLIAYTVGGNTVLGQMQWEGVYNGINVAPEDTWQTTDLTNQNFWVWGGATGNRGPLNTTCGNANNSGAMLWQSANAWATGNCLTDGVVYGVALSIGSGWGDFEGYVDNPTWKGANQILAYSANFENNPTGGETVPEPATMTLLAAGLAGMGAAKRRKKK